MKFKTLLVFFLVSILNVFSQTTYKFNSDSYDFGELIEDDLAIHLFTVKNTGNSPLIISDVRPSCGCTTPEWSREPVMPRKEGSIKATYGTHGRLGFFNKSITVTTNGEPAMTTLYIKGSVFAKSESKYSDAELKLSPKLILEKTEHNFGKVEKGAKLPVKVTITNLGRSDLKITQVSSACNCISFNSKQEFIKSGEKGIIELIYAPYSTGFQIDNAYIKSNDILKPSQKVTLTANIVDAIEPSLMKESSGSNSFK